MLAPFRSLLMGARYAAPGRVVNRWPAAGCDTQRTVRRWIWIAIIVVIGVAAIVMVGDVEKLGDRLTGFRWGAFVLCLGLALLNYAIRFLRWQLYLRHQQVSVPVASSAVVFGAGLSLSITPAKLGEL